MLVLLLATALLAAPADFDGDGVPDETDDCPTDAGKADNNGCPSIAPPSKAPPDSKLADLPAPGWVEFRSGYIAILRPLLFKSGSAELLPSADPVLDALAKTIRHHVPQGKHIKVRGHTDDRGKKEANVALSKARAAAVVERLAGLGVPRERLSSDGVGPVAPIATNKTAVGRAQNRRVDVLVLDAP